jgi:acyl-CoA thioesterase FadM
MISVHKTVSHPWQCDIMGHMTTRFYMAMFDDSSYHFLHHVFGWNSAQDPTGKLGWVLGSGDVAATLKGVVVLFDLENRCAVRIPDDLRKAAQEHVRTDFV